MALGDWLDMVSSEDTIIQASAVVCFMLMFLLVVFLTSLSCSMSTLSDPINDARIPQEHLTLYKETEFLYATTKIRNVLYNPRAADLSSSLERGDLLLCFL